LRPLTFGGEVDAVLGWGNAAVRARAAADRRKIPVWTVRDGFLAGVGTEQRRPASLSFLLDDLGDPFSAAAPSRLEHLIAASAPTADEAERVENLRRFITDNRLGRYCGLEKAERPGPKTGRRILIVDQSFDDPLVAGALAGRADISVMARDVVETGGAAEVLLWPAPRGKGGCQRALATLPASAVRVLLDQGSALDLLDDVDEVWTVADHIGFEALLRGLPVRTYGAPFYAGWNLTQDRATGAEAKAALARRAATPRNLAQFLHAALVAYPVYVDPALQTLTTPEEAARQLLAWRGEARALGRDHICVGFSYWKQPHLRGYLGASGGRQRFMDEFKAKARAQAGDHVMVWGMKADDGFAESLRQRGVTVTRCEDGFVRSLGLGSNFLFPWSLCFDASGMYYDARQPSDLEILLNSGAPDPQLTRKAQRVRQRLVEMRVSKYNLGGTRPEGLRAKAGARRIVLATGQVPDDFSIKLGLSLFTSNLDFLATVRRENPQAFIVYKEHPDIASGNRPGASDPEQLQALADMVLSDGDICEWIEACDHLHVMTSLAGFEALLREKPVTCWGAPFYAGWGLTEDKLKIDRRTFRPSVDELAARVLLQYSHFRLLHSVVPVSIDALLEHIATHPQVKGWGPAGTRKRFGAKARRLFGYFAAQLAGAAGGRAETLHSLAGARWPFFR
jgi:capsular polysaccharide export protein